MSMGRWSNLLLGRGNILPVENVKCPCLFLFLFWLFVNAMSELISSVALLKCLSHQLRDESCVSRCIWNMHISRLILLSQRTVVKLLLTGTGAASDSDVLVFCNLQCTGSEIKERFTTAVNLDIMWAMEAHNCSHPLVFKRGPRPATSDKIQPFYEKITEKWFCLKFVLWSPEDDSENGYELEGLLPKLVRKKGWSSVVWIW